MFLMLFRSPVFLTPFHTPVFLTSFNDPMFLTFNSPVFVHRVINQCFRHHSTSQCFWRLQFTFLYFKHHLAVLWLFHHYAAHCSCRLSLQAVFSIFKEIFLRYMNIRNTRRQELWLVKSVLKVRNICHHFTLQAHWQKLVCFTLLMYVSFDRSVSSLSSSSSSIFFNREDSWGTTDDFATSFLHFSLFSTALWDLPISRPLYSLMMSSHLFLCLPCLLLPFTVPCKMVLARPDERETCPYHCSLRLFTIVRRSSCGPVACWILARTSSLVTWSLYVMCSILR